MALPTHLRNGLSPAEVAFLAESMDISIQPRQTMPSLQLLDRTIPAFKPPQSVQVPLWLALLLKRQRRARIMAPQWLNPDSLQKFLDDEQKDEAFSALPFQWLEFATSLLERFQPSCSPPYSSSRIDSDCSASDDIVEPELTRRLIRDLREVRQAKARKGIQALGETHLQMDNLGLMEINEIRFLDMALDRLRLLSNTKAPNEEDVEMSDLNGESQFTSQPDWED